MYVRAFVSANSTFWRKRVTSLCKWSILCAQEEQSLTCSGFGDLTFGQCKCDPERCVSGWDWGGGWGRGVCIDILYFGSSMVCVYTVTLHSVWLPYVCFYWEVRGLHRRGVKWPLSSSHPIGQVWQVVSMWLWCQQQWHHWHHRPGVPVSSC